jgi:hypothetical protein
MGLLDVNISKEDRPRVDAIIQIMRRLTDLLSALETTKQVVIRIEVADKQPK